MDALRVDNQRQSRACAMAPDAAGESKEAAARTASAADPTRRDFLYLTTAAVGSVGALAGMVSLIAR